MPPSQHQIVLQTLATDRKLAHDILFKHRHPLPGAPYFPEMIDLWHSWQEKSVIEIFRDGAKSTTGEEAMCILAGFQDFHNGVIVGSTEPRALERLEAVKHEIETNENYIEVFGEQVGDVWAGRRSTLANGVHLQALGVGQSVRGIKHHAFRPDFLWIDDIEDEDSDTSPEACKARLKWLYGTLLPVCARHRTRIRMTGNSMSSESVVASVARDPAWKHLHRPICYRDLNTGEEMSSWPDKFDMDWIRNRRDEYERLGLVDIWNREYMCETMQESRKPFKQEHYRVRAIERRFHAVTAAWDPARSQEKKSAATAKAVWSWVGAKLVIWDGSAKVGQPPSELIDDIFETDDRFNPTMLAVEENGLEEWLKEPLRLEQLKRRHLLPHLLPVRAPKNKDGFIRSLQPYFAAGDIEFATDFPEAKHQLGQYPAGRNDVLNIIAYALRLRPGDPVYEDFTEENVASDIYPLRGKKYLAINAKAGVIAAVLMQYDGVLEILWDLIMEGDPAQIMPDLLTKARLECKGEMEIVLPPKEFDRYANQGLNAAVRRSLVLPSQGKLPEKGRETIREMLNRKSKGGPSLLIAERASWVLRGFAGGYHLATDRRGQPMPEAEDNVYRIVMEAVESFAGIMQHATEPAADDQNAGHMSRAKDGTLYRSTIQGRR